MTLIVAILDSQLVSYYYWPMQTISEQFPSAIGMRASVSTSQLYASLSAIVYS